MMYFGSWLINVSAMYTGWAKSRVTVIVCHRSKFRIPVKKIKCITFLRHE